MNRLLAILDGMRKRPEMYSVWDYRSLVAYIDGYAAASPTGLLDGFNDWVSERLIGDVSGRHWAVLVAESQYVDEGRQRSSWSDLSADESVAARDRLMTLLTEFLEQRTVD